MEVILETIITIVGIIAVLFFGICVIGLLVSICGLPIAAIYGIYLIITHQPLIGFELFLVSFFSGIIVLIIEWVFDYVKNKT